MKGIGPKRAEELETQGLRCVEDLLLHIPFRYEDRSRFYPIAHLQPGLRATVRGRVVTGTLRRTRVRGFSIFEAIVEDGSGSIRAVFFNQPYLRTLLAPGREVVLHGQAEISRYRGRNLVLQAPQFEVLSAGDDDTIHTGRMVPIYGRLPGLSSRMIRRAVHSILKTLPDVLLDPLPMGVAAKRRFPDRRAAFEGVHFPPEGCDPDLLARGETAAHRRLIFEEFFFLQLGFAISRSASDANGRANPLRVDGDIRSRLHRALPFHLTGAQKRVLKEIADDLMSGRPMNRLLQGDVGSGKTIVALLAALLAVENGHQVAFMAPTEILAEQHHRSFTRILQGRGYRIALLTAGVQGASRRQVLTGLKTGVIPILVGTHALIEEEVNFASLRLVVIDEQHRFGVAQRARLRAKGERPDVLVMTATPIPRSLALTAYGDLDLSVIDELPPGRVPIRTVLRRDGARPRVYDFLRAQVAAGRQVYIVYPLVEETDRSDLRAATEMAERLRGDVFAGITVGLLHGRMKPDEREATMSGFLNGRIAILVSTTVIEVGVDVPNASVMMIEQAERFGLSQLHQLRGRVGRGTHESFCILMEGSAVTEDARRRLQVMCDTSDGFVIARRDLEIRGPGEFLGTRQSGIPDLRVGDIVRHHEILEDARREAFAVAGAVRRRPESGPDILVEHLERRWSGRLGIVRIG